MWAQHPTHERGFRFIYPPPRPAPSLLRSSSVFSLHPRPLPSISPSLSCFDCRSEVSSVCCIHFQFPFCGGIPLVIMLSFPTLALRARTYRPEVWLSQHKEWKVQFQIFVSHAQMKITRTDADKDAETAAVLHVILCCCFKQNTDLDQAISLTLSVLLFLFYFPVWVDPQKVCLKREQLSWYFSTEH